MSVIVPSFDGWELTDACLSSVREHSPGVEVVLVDNGSESEAPASVMDRVDRWVGIEPNLGFGIAANVGAQAASGDLLLFLNNDTEVHEGWLEPLVAVFADVKVGAAAGRLVFPDGRLQHAGVRLFMRSGVLTAENLTSEQPAGEVVCVAGTAVCVRREAWLDVGGFDTGFYNGYEDVDLCLRLGERGWKIRYVPESTVMHHCHASGPSRWAKVRENIALLHERWGERF